jgi:hypothetical protein
MTGVVKNAFQVGYGEPFAPIRYFSTVDFATTMPSFPGSPTMRGDPQAGFAREIWGMSSRRSRSILGRPGRLL